MSVQKQITIEKDFFNFNLNHPIKYGGGGEQIEAYDLTVTGPSGKAKLICFKLEQLLFQATFQANSLFNKSKASSAVSNEGEGEEKAEKEAMTPDVIGMLFRASEIDIETALDLLRSLALSGGIHVNTVKMSPMMWNQIDVDDMLKLLFKYCSFFISASDSSVI